MLRTTMEAAGFPETITNEVMGIIENLQNKGQWDKILQISNAIMEEDGKNIKEQLGLARNLEAELGVHKYTLELLALIPCWAMTRDRYIENGISLDIYNRTVQDMRAKMQECRDVYEVTGIFVGEWYNRFFAVTRFALGRLQFETETYPLDIPFEKDGVVVKKGDSIVNVKWDAISTEKSNTAGFEILKGTLPALGANESYIIEYDVIEEGLSSGKSEYISHQNEAEAKVHYAWAMKLASDMFRATKQPRYESLIKQLESKV